MVEARQLTDQEIEAFQDYLWFWEDWFIPPEGRFEYFPDLGGFVLMFEKQDGTIEYILTDKDYNALVPDSGEYYNRESWEIFWNKANDLSGGVIGGVGDLASGLGKGIENITNYIPWIAIGVIAYYFKDEIKGLFRSKSK